MIYLTLHIKINENASLPKLIDIPDFHEVYPRFGYKIRVAGLEGRVVVRNDLTVQCAMHSRLRQSLLVQVSIGIAAAIADDEDDGHVAEVDEEIPDHCLHLPFLDPPLCQVLLELWIEDLPLGLFSLRAPA